MIILKDNRELPSADNLKKKNKEKKKNFKREREGGWVSWESRRWQVVTGAETLAQSKMTVCAFEAEVYEHFSGFSAYLLLSTLIQTSFRVLVIPHGCHAGGVASGIGTEMRDGNGPLRCFVFIFKHDLMESCGYCF